MIFLEIIFVIFLYVISDTWLTMTDSFNAENILLKDRCSFIQLEVFIILLYGYEIWSSEANMVLFRAVYIHASKRF